MADQSPSAVADLVDAALARAVVYRVLSLGFQPPTHERLDEMRAGNRFDVLARAVEVLRPGAALEAAVARLQAISARTTGELSSAYWRLFGHTTRGLVCAFETEYGPENNFQQPQQLADLAGYYLAFGLRPRLTVETRPDHIACECEFMDFLSRKQARFLDRPADGQSLEETLTTTDCAVKSFLRDHLGRFGRAFAARLASEDHDGFYAALAGVLLAFVSHECARVGVEAGPVDLAVRPEEIDDTPMACGTGRQSSEPQLIQIQRHP
jgi:TorA maturation chaperone TorD